jgi:TAZ zinc finger
MVGCHSFHGVQCLLLTAHNLSQQVVGFGRHLDLAAGEQAHDRSKRFVETEQRMSETEQKERKKQLERTMALLIHASTCNNANCPSTNCSKVKNLFSHSRVCPQRVQGGCQLCR